MPAVFSAGNPANFSDLLSLTIRNGSADLPVTYWSDLTFMSWLQDTDVLCQAGPTGTEATLLDCRGMGSVCYSPFTPPVLTVAGGATHTMQCRYGWGGFGFHTLPLQVQ